MRSKQRLTMALRRGTMDDLALASSPWEGFDMTW